MPARQLSATAASLDALLFSHIPFSHKSLADARGLSAHAADAQAQHRRAHGQARAHQSHAREDKREILGRHLAPRLHLVEGAAEGVRRGRRGGAVAGAVALAAGAAADALLGIREGLRTDAGGVPSVGVAAQARHVPAARLWAARRGCAAGAAAAALRRTAAHHLAGHVRHVGHLRHHALSSGRRRAARDHQGRQGPQHGHGRKLVRRVGKGWGGRRREA
mmetsp:Transcript_23128/g.54733  ORF Transcript_23128/g.54733 Transcript_23128/m.54733 type:complete len:220 (+) Transcript_23128:102-761(+)